MTSYICSNKSCNSLFNIKENILQFKCSKCQSPLALKKNIQLPENFKQLVKERDANLWRYKEALPLEFSLENVVSLGEGMTPLIPFQTDFCKNLKLKMVIILVEAYLQTFIAM